MNFSTYVIHLFFILGSNSNFQKEISEKKSIYVEKNNTFELWQINISQSINLIVYSFTQWLDDCANDNNWVIGKALEKVLRNITQILSLK